MGLIRNAARAVPGLHWAYRKAYNLSLRLKSPEDVFTDIYRNNKWYGTESVSGVGSDAMQTRVIVEALPRIFRELGVCSVLDVPCGDFFWMAKVDLAGIDYLGGDIVADIIERNTAAHGGPGIRFRKVDLINDKLPKADLILVRDCLVHLSYDNIRKALRNIRSSGATYLLTTTFPGRTIVDIQTGRWRPLDLQAAPFHLPTPLRQINEACTEATGKFSDKTLALWRVPDIFPGI